MNFHSPNYFVVCLSHSPPHYVLQLLLVNPPIPSILVLIHDIAQVLAHPCTTRSYYPRHPLKYDLQECQMKNMSGVAELRFDDGKWSLQRSYFDDVALQVAVVVRSKEATVAAAF